MLRILGVLLIVLSHLGADLIDIYRTQGIEAVKKQLEKQLEERTYWEKFLENKDVKYGYYEDTKYLIFCQKNKKKLKVYKKIDNGFSQIINDSVIVGKKEGDKQIEGDLKTPIGAYELTNKITKLDSFYGPLALVTSYPNTFDKLLNKKGHGIWIHGMPIDKNREEYTKGCIALDNPELENIDKNIDIEKSILLISQDSLKKSSKDEISLILSSIYKWKNAWKESDIDEYLSFYSSEFKKDNRMNLEQFSTYKKRIFRKNEKKSIDFYNIDVIPYPNSLNKKMYKVVMDEKYFTKNYRFEGKKELYLEIKDNKIQILAES